MRRLGEIRGLSRLKFKQTNPRTGHKHHSQTSSSSYARSIVVLNEFK